MRVSVIGLGKLGAPLAAVLASKGHSVIGVDMNPEFVRRINEGVAPVVEPGLQALIDVSRDRLRATSDFAEAVEASEVSFVIVPTPSDAQGIFSNRFVIDAVTNIGKALSRGDSYHVVNITSTVMPGSTGGEIADALERTSKRRVGETVGLCYNPEFIALGSVVRDMLNPDMVLLGESDPRAGALVASVYEGLCDNGAKVRRMPLIDAELVKIAINTYVTTKISYANMLAEICERLPGADVDIVTSALGLDTRIGGKYLRGAVGYGGPCFPRDNIAFGALGRRLGVPTQLVEATDSVNRHQVERLLNLVRANVPGRARIAVLGLSYKPETPVIEGSQSVDLAVALSAEGYQVTVHDPQAMEPALAVLGNRVSGAPSIEAALEQADGVVIMTPWTAYRSIDWASATQRPKVIDPWHVVDPALCGNRAVLVPVGRSPIAPAARKRVAARAAS